MIGGGRGSEGSWIAFNPSSSPQTLANGVLPASDGVVEFGRVCTETDDLPAGLNGRKTGIRAVPENSWVTDE